MQVIHEESLLRSTEIATLLREDVGNVDVRIDEDANADKGDEKDEQEPSTNQCQDKEVAQSIDTGRDDDAEGVDVPVREFNGHRKPAIRCQCFGACPFSHATNYTRDIHNSHTPVIIEVTGVLTERAFIMVPIQLAYLVWMQEGPPQRYCKSATWNFVRYTMTSTQVPTPADTQGQPKLDLDDTLGAVFMGNVVVAVLYGISCVQMYMYHQRSSRDSRTMQALIYFLWILDTLQLIFWTEAIYYFCVTNYLNPSAFIYSPWSFLADYVAGLLSDTIVTAVYAYRLRRLGGRFAVAQLVVQSITMLVSCGTGSAFIGLSWGKVQTEVNTRYRWLMITEFTAKAVGDTFIAVTLWITLRRRRTGVKRTENLIRELVLYSVSTCTLTSISVIGTVITLVTMPHTLIFDAFAIALPKLVFNSLLAFLNSREHFALNTSTDQPLSIHLSRLAHSDLEPGGSKASKNLNAVYPTLLQLFYVLTNFHGNQIQVKV
ncbi:hypothetical protein NM688_g2895 [Phlebia brevispora]|uniref:Uncharacterized protein n=1 Tax=Phlebia brevispora TaxID=194682 RepID=A0ACC1T730_9APHY|nr:hypothetical protein NM688_g2895 [Phlebia brevispora]